MEQAQARFDQFARVVRTVDWQRDAADRGVRRPATRGEW
jgi:hypothetical protein